ncbi:MAG: hypothetical protein U0703_08235 [Anaerolineae bacterium]
MPRARGRTRSRAGTAAGVVVSRSSRRASSITGSSGVNCTLMTSSPLPESTIRVASSAAN